MTDILGPYGVGFVIGTLVDSGSSSTHSLRLHGGLFPLSDLTHLPWPRPLRVPLSQLRRSCLSHLGHDCPLHDQYPTSFGLTPHPQPSENPIGSEYKPSLQIPPLLRYLSFAVHHRRVLHDPDPHSQKRRLVANFAVFLNLLMIFITMGVMAHNPPNFSISVLGSAGSAVEKSTTTLPTHNPLWGPPCPRTCGIHQRLAIRHACLPGGAALRRVSS